GSQLGVPRRPVRPHEVSIGLRVANDLFLRGVPAQLASQPQRQIREVTNGADAMPALHIGDRLLPRLDAVEEVADMPLELIALAASAVLGGRRPVFGRSRLGSALRPADRM